MVLLSSLLTKHNVCTLRSVHWRPAGWMSAHVQWNITSVTVLNCSSLAVGRHYSTNAVGWWTDEPNVCALPQGFDEQWVLSGHHRWQATSLALLHRLARYDSFCYDLVESLLLRLAHQSESQPFGQTARVRGRISNRVRSRFRLSLWSMLELVWHLICTVCTVLLSSKTSVWRSIGISWLKVELCLTEEKLIYLDPHRCQEFVNVHQPDFPLQVCLFICFCMLLVSATGRRFRYCYCPFFAVYRHFGMRIISLFE